MLVCLRFNVSEFADFLNPGYVAVIGFLRADQQVL